MNTEKIISTFKNVNNLHELRLGLDLFNKSLLEGQGKLWTCYTQIFNSSLEKPLIYLHNRFPLEWQIRYDEKNYHLIDPSWGHCKHSTIPFFWSDIKNLTQEQKAMVDDAFTHGFRSGVLIPFHGRTGYSLLWIMSPKNENESRHCLELIKRRSYEILPFIYEAVTQTVFGNKPILTKRETEVLYWIAEGLRTDETGEKLKISPATVEKHVSNACTKLEAKNRTQCVRIALNLGVIIPGETSFNYYKE